MAQVVPGPLLFLASIHRLTNRALLLGQGLMFLIHHLRAILEHDIRAYIPGAVSGTDRLDHIGESRYCPVI